MTRLRRIWIEGHFYHIVCRGNRRDPLFRDSTDFNAFLYILQQLHEKYPFDMASYCLMTNHYHLQLRSLQISHSKFMALLNKRYADYYNTKYDLTGHVYEKRFFDKILLGREGMIEVSRYIHLNPVTAGIVQYPEQYPWSSYSLYKYPLIPNQLSFMNIASVLDYYEGNEEQKRKTYCGACHSSNGVES